MGFLGIDVSTEEGAKSLIYSPSLQYSPTSSTSQQDSRVGTINYSPVTTFDSPYANISPSQTATTTSTPTLTTTLIPTNTQTSTPTVSAPTTQGKGTDYITLILIGAMALGGIYIFSKKR